MLCHIRKSRVKISWPKYHVTLSDVGSSQNNWTWVDEDEDSDGSFQEFELEMVQDIPSPSGNTCGVMATGCIRTILV